jgi:hypothetical protein
MLQRERRQTLPGDLRTAAPVFRAESTVARQRRRFKALNAVVPVEVDLVPGAPQQIGTRPLHPRLHVNASDSGDDPNDLSEDTYLGSTERHHAGRFSRYSFRRNCL